MTLSALSSLSLFAGRSYAVLSEVFTVSAILWGVKLTSDIMEKVYKAAIATYVAGTMVGQFYFDHVHEALLTFLYNVIITITKVIGYSVGFCVYVYRERNTYFGEINRVRNIIGSQFVYAY